MNASGFWRRVDKNGDGGCWLWTGAKTSNGYGYLNTDGGRRLAHRFSYESLVGPIPAGLQLDHLCRVRHCVNPTHLEPVTQRENVLRGEGLSAANARKTHCSRGHEYTPENTYIYAEGRRHCRPCALANARARRAALSARSEPTGKTQ